jgi:hypothetical protein
MPTTHELLDAALEREYGEPVDVKAPRQNINSVPHKDYLWRVSLSLWDMLDRAAKLNGLSVAAWLRLQAAAAAQEQIHHAEVELQTVELKPSYLRVGGGSSMAVSIR